MSLKPFVAAAAIVLALPAAAAVPSSQRDALISFYNATGGPNWTSNAGWNGSPGTECSWSGVRCDAAGATVEQIYLPNNNLVGTLPSALQNLTGLKILYLAGNSLGSLPALLGNVKSLEELTLSYCDLSGAIPAELGGLPALRILDVQANQLSGAIPPSLGSLSALEILTLNDNALTGTVPVELSRLAKLSELYLGGNSLTGTIPKELGSLPSITVLSLRDNRFSGQIPAELGNLRTVQALRLYNNQLTGPIPASLGSLAAVTELDLSANQLSGSIPKELGGLPKIEALFLASNLLTGPIPAELGKLTTLTELALEGNQLTAIPAELGNLKNLTYLSIYNNQLTGAIPKELGNLSSLDTLYLAYNQLQGTVPAELGNLAKLRRLYLNSNQLTGLNAPALARLTSLAELSVGGNPFGGAMPDLTSLKQLTLLDLSACGFTGSIPSWLGSLTKLENVALDDNELTGGIPAFLGGMTPLRGLYLQNNQLSGSIPGELGQLSSLVELGLNGNQLTGTIPPQLGSLVMLQGLNLSRNQLQGSIPAELGSLTQLQGLDLSENRLGGSIPVELGRLTQLAGLNLSENQLSGAIPASLGGLTSVAYLTLSTNSLGGPIPPELGNLANLQELRLTGNQLTAIPAELGRLQKLYLLNLDGNALAGAIPRELGNLASLEWLTLQANQLTGSIPPEFGRLSKLVLLNIGYNQLAGPLPAELGSLSALQYLELNSNQLTGPLPDSLGNLRSLLNADLSLNRIGGSIPASLGNLSSLDYISLAGNALSGDIPSTLTKLTRLTDGYGIQLAYNALDTQDAALRAFLVSKSGNWDDTQTKAPPGLAVSVASTASLTLSWNAIAYQDDPGGYEVWSFTGGGTPTLAVTTSSKRQQSATIGSLTPGTSYSFFVKSFTLPHDRNPNRVVSVASATITGSTLPAGSVTVSLTPAAQKILTGASGTLTATVAPAATSAITVTLTSRNASVARVPASVTIAAGGSSATFAAQGGNVGTTTIIAALPASLGGGAAAADVTVDTSTCDRPNVPGFVSSPSAPVRGGNSFTLAWTATLAGDPGGTYQLDVAPNADCRTGVKRISTTSPSVTVPTSAGQAGTFCAVVRAISSLNCPSGDSSPVQIQVEAGPAAFVVGEGQAPSAVTTLGVAPAPSKVVFKNIGSQPATLTVRPSLAFASASPSSVPNVLPGGTAEVTITYDVQSTLAPAVQLGSLCGGWADGSQQRTVCTAVALTTLSQAPAPDPAAGKLQFTSNSEVHFIAAAGATPPTQSVSLRNTGAKPARLGLSIGPGGAWVNVTGDLTTPIAPSATRTLVFTADRSKRATADGAPPLTTQVTFVNVDGASTDRAILQVFDEEPVGIGSGTGRAYLGTSEYSLVLPSGVSAAGSGALFLSDGWIRNKAPVAVNADLYYTPGGADGVGHPQVARANVTLQPYGTYRLADFVRGLFGVTGSGSVEVRSSSVSNLSVRTTVDSLSVKNGAIVRFGAEIPTVQSREGVSLSRNGGASLFLPGLKGGAGSAFRTNIILTETSGRPLTVLLRLLKQDGSLVKEKTETVLSYSKTQLNFNDPDLFPPGVNIDGASLEVKPVSGAGSVAAFATVIDNTSQGYTTRTGRFVSAPASGRTPNAAPITRLAVAAAAHVQGRNNSFFTTTLSITNGTASAAQLKVRYLPDGGGEVPAQNVTVPPRASANYPDVVSTLFGINDNSAGMVFVEGDVSRVVVTSDTSTPLDPNQPAGVSPSTLGAYAPESANAVGDPQGGPPSPVISHPGLEQSNRFRTNLILAEVAGAPATVRVRLVPSGSGGVPLAEKQYTLAAFERRQINQFMLELTGSGPDVPYLDCETIVEWVSGSGRVLSVATKIDNDPDSKRSDLYVLGPVGALQGTIGF